MIVILLDFYLLPLLIIDTGTAIILLLAVIPLICFCISILYGIKNSFNALYAIIVAVLFAPSIFIFYNTSAWVYIIAYGVLALIGNAIGMIFFKRTN